ncbi:unnamed protein product [Ambrosiozyma monospora]|uniref:Unnamed protein product n=1 Tax=Ambrosiozyma monospora TaxID=43982 RepID=A0ACB5UA12_AMBMO|nr:unnamed protein product [Ambrosiozyma monospora]
MESNVLKYKATLYNSVEWLIYAILPDGSSGFEFNYTGPYNIYGNKAIDGLTVQIAPMPSSGLDSYFDQAAGMYPLNCSVEGSYIGGGSEAVYKLVYHTEGSSSSRSTMIFALPHLTNSLIDESSGNATGITIYSPTKGTMTGYLTNTLTMSETLNFDIGFLPYAQISNGTSLTYTTDQLKLIAQAANSELATDIPTLIAGQEMDSTYGAGNFINSRSIR